MKKKIKHIKGSAMLIAVIVLATIVPIAILAVDVDLLVGQNTVKMIDSQMADSVTRSGVADLKRIMEDDPNYIANHQDYYVDVEANIKTTGTFVYSGKPRNRMYYEVKKNADAVSFTVFGYYAGIKHAYKYAPCP